MCQVCAQREVLVAGEQETNQHDADCKSDGHVSHTQRLGLVASMFVCLTSMLEYLRDGSASAIAHAATPRQKVQIKLAISSSHSILTLSHLVLILTL